MKSVIILLLAVVLVSPSWGDSQVFRSDHVEVNYEGVGQDYISAIAEIVEIARRLAQDSYGFDIPETVKIEVNCSVMNKVRLYNDGNDRIYLTVSRPEDLRKPAASGYFHIYGLCHEIGHLAMYRLIKDHSFLTSAAAEGWAHYLGSYLLDGVYSQAKGDLWPDKYNYLADGTERLKKQLADQRSSDIEKAVGYWMEFNQIIGDKGMASVFSAWGKVKYDPSDPGGVLRKSLLEINAQEKVSDWWNKIEPLYITKRPQSGFPVRQVDKRELSQEAVELKLDDGKQAGKSSIAGGGHAVEYQVSGNDWYLCSLKIYGSRYGMPAPPNEDFHIWLCDKDMEVIADFPVPYKRFGRGAPRWVNIAVEPTNVPPDFIVGVNFNPSGTKGVFVGYDAEGQGSSISGLPGKDHRRFDKGDWMIRVKLDTLKSANPLVAAD